MPLLKLWNALWGRASGEQPVVEQPESPLPAKTSDKPASQGNTGAGIISSGLSLFSGNPHLALCKLVAATKAQSVLEVTVGDGSRAIAVVATLTKQGVPVRYLGIDEFELAGSPTSLKEFHQTLRAAGIRPQIFPEAVDRGLVRCLHTIGTVDLVLLSEPGEILEDPRIRQLLTRISHANTTILHRRPEGWARLTTGSTEIRRAA